jgi:hypothetical protein
MPVNRRGWIVAGLVAVVLLALAQRQLGTHDAPAGQPPLAHLDAQSLDMLRADFNRAAGEARIILLLSPT